MITVNCRISFSFHGDFNKVPCRNYCDMYTLQSHANTVYTKFVYCIHKRHKIVYLCLKYQKLIYAA